MPFSSMPLLAELKPRTKIFRSKKHLTNFSEGVIFSVTFLEE
jgi:hypothetical protein